VMDTRASKSMLSCKRFLLYSFIGFLSLVVAYPLLVDRYVFIERELPFVYRQLLLESTAEVRGKIIVESGSNSIHGIDPVLMAEYFKRPVITIADNGDYPLHLKLHQLNKFAQQGDSLILPLEWNQYYDSAQLKENFVSALVDENLTLEYYYESLPVIEKIRFLYTQFPFYQALLSLTHERNALTMLQEDLKHLARFERLQKLASVESFGNSTRNGPEPKVPAPINKTCESYLFHGGFDISTVFKGNLLLLQELREKGVNIYFTWPAVVDHKSSACYTGLEHVKAIKKYAQAIETLVAAAGFQFIGNFQQSHFAENCFLNTHYHLRRECAIKRTELLIENFKAAGVRPYPHESTQYTQLVGQYIDEKRQDLLNKMIQYYPVITQADISARQLSAFVLLSLGWSNQEDWGVWSDGEQSELVFNVAPALLAKKYLTVTIKGKYYNGSEQTKVRINGKSFGAAELLNASFTIASNSLVNNRIHISLTHLKHASPKALGLGADNRAIKFGLTSLALAPVSIRDE